MKQCLIAKAAVLLLLVIVFAAPTGAWAQLQQHSAQVLDEQYAPMEGVLVTFHIPVEGQGMQEFGQETNAQGIAIVNVDYDREELSWWVEADDEEYFGPDGGPEQPVFYNKYHVLLDPDPGGMR